MTDAQRIIRAILEEEEDFKDVTGPPDWLAGINPALMEVLTRLGVTSNRIVRRYGDVYVMCPTWQEASQIKQAGIWKSMAEVSRTNPDHPDAKQFPWLCDIPLANLAGHVADHAR